MSTSNSIKPSKFPSFRICTYNVLVQHFIDCEKYPHSNAEHVAWEFRWKLLQSALDNANADIFCLQEVEESAFQDYWFAKFRDLGCQAHFQAKPSWGNVVAFRSSKFSLEWIDSRSRALLVCLRMLENDHLLFIANVHLSAKFDKTEEKMSQVKSLMKQIQNRVKTLNVSSDSYSIVVCGDFNSNPSQGVYNLFMDGFLRKEYRDSYGNSYSNDDVILPCQFRSAHLEKFSCEPKWTVSVTNHDFVDTVDYIMYSDDKIEIVDCEEVTSARTSKHIPNETNPSDHLPIIAELRVRVSAIRPLKRSASA